MSEFTAGLETLPRVRNVICSISEETPCERIEAKADIEDDLGIDSLDWEDIVSELNRHFGIRLPDPVPKNIGRLCDRIDELMAQKHSNAA
jgi:acyl carrier protein